MKRTQLPPRLKQILTEVPYVTLATVCPDGRPWNTPVYGAFDDELNLYWASWPGNQHSLNLVHDSRIFVVAYNSTAPEGDGIGIYLEMTARKLTRPSEIAAARRVYTTNFGENLDHEPFANGCPRRLYKATPMRIWHNSDSYIQGNFIDVRREVTV
jgi:Pyridoxamine 5''-phosphate oxidase.